MHVLIALTFVVDSSEVSTLDESYFEEHRLIDGHIDEKVLQRGGYSIDQLIADVVMPSRRALIAVARSSD